MCFSLPLEFDRDSVARIVKITMFRTTTDERVSADSHAESTRHKADPISHVTKIARAALHRIAEEKLAPTPEVYARIYAQICGEPAPVQAPGMPDATKEAHAIVDAVIQTIGSFSTGITEWDDKFKHIVERSDHIKTPADVARVVQTILKSQAELSTAASKSQRELTETRRRLERISAELQRFETLAMSDPLTGVSNRRGLYDALARDVAAAVRMKVPLSLAIMDIDHFKRINDEHGHQAGDRALTHFARVIKSGIRAMDSLCRYGGEEFVLMLPNTGAQGAHFVIDRLRVKMENTPLSSDDLRITVRFSAGVAELQPDETGEAMLQRADMALLRAKQSGRNKVLIADPH